MIRRREFRSCAQSPLEFKDVALQKWWRKLFHELEEIHFKERHKIGSVVGEVVAQRTYDILKPILQLDSRTVQREAVDEVSDPPTPVDFLSLDRETEPSIAPTTISEQPSKGHHDVEWAENEGEWEFTEHEEKHEITEEEAVVVLPDEETKSEVTEEGSNVSSLFVEPGLEFSQKEECEEPYTNPYLKFLKLPKEKAAIWRPVKDPIPTGLDRPDPNLELQEKSALVTYLISKEFYDWFKSIGGTEVHTFSDKVLSELFCVGFDQLAAHALCSRKREMASVPTGVSAETEISEANYREALKREIKRDSLAEKIPKRTYGFGSTIKQPDRWVPPHNNADTWLKCCRVREEIATFSMVWQGITHLSSTKAFVHWLKERPHLPRPQYLREMHMFDPKVRPGSPDRPGSPPGKMGQSISGGSYLDDNFDDMSSSSSSAAGGESNENVAKYGIL